MSNPRTSTDPNQPALADVSPRGIRLARVIDRLEPGTYTIRLEKDADGEKRLRIEITRTEHLTQEWEF